MNDKSNLLTIWHIVTPEYPPDRGGVADYSFLVAQGLRNVGQTVHIWCPTSATRKEPPECWVHPQVRGLGLRGLRRVGKELNRFPGPRKLLVQWVPHGYGWHAMNVPFCLWMLLRALLGDDVQIMLHEAFLPFEGGTWRQAVAAAVQRLMTVILLGSTRRVWMSSPSWKQRLQPYSLGKNIEFTWLPIPSNIPVVANGASVARLRASYTPGGEPLVGHFGTYGRSTADMLDKIIPSVLSANPNCKLLLIGANGDLYQKKFQSQHPHCANRVIAIGASDASTVSQNLMACDLMIQPYPEGVTARRGSCLAGLSHGKAIVTTAGEMTEDFWCEAPRPVELGRSCGETVSITNRLLCNRQELRTLGERARAFYRQTFALEHLIRRLQLDISPTN